MPELLYNSNDNENINVVLQNHPTLDDPPINPSESDGDAASTTDDGKVVSDNPICSDLSLKCFGPCGGKLCEDRVRWQVCRNNVNDFVKCSKVVGELCQESHGGYCRVCIIAGSTATKRYLS